MLKRLTGAVVATLVLTGPGFAWTDIYIERAAMAELGHQLCNINNRSLAARYKDRAVFFNRLLSPAAVDSQVERRAEVLLGRLTNASAVDTFCGRIRSKDF